MGYNYNHITVVGRLTKDPITKTFSDKKVKTFFTVAVNRPYSKDGEEPEVDFFPVSMWGKLAELSAKLLKKGDPVLVWGEVQINRFEKDGASRSATEVSAAGFQILTHHKKNDGEEGNKT